MQDTTMKKAGFKARWEDFKDSEEATLATSVIKTLALIAVLKMLLELLNTSLWNYLAKKSTTPLKMELGERHIPRWAKRWEADLSQEL